MINERLSAQLAFIHEIDRLKYVIRQTALFGSERRENSAEHSWHLALMVLSLKAYANEPIDELRVLKMLLLHDLVEIDTGDTFLFDQEGRKAVKKDELIAAKRIFGLLPTDQSAEFLALWQEFEAGESADACFAQCIDHLEPILQNLSNQGGTWTKNQIDLHQVLAKKSRMARGSLSLWTWAKAAIEAHFDAQST